MRHRAAGAPGGEAGAERTVGGATRLELGLPGGSGGRASWPFLVPRGRPRRRRAAGPRRSPCVWGVRGRSRAGRGQGQGPDRCGRGTGGRTPQLLRGPRSCPPGLGDQGCRDAGPCSLGLSQLAGWTVGQSVSLPCVTVGVRRGPGDCVRASAGLPTS